MSAKLSEYIKDEIFY